MVTDWMFPILAGMLLHFGIQLYAIEWECRWIRECVREEFSVRAGWTE